MAYNQNIIEIKLVRHFKSQTALSALLTLAKLNGLSFGIAFSSCIKIEKFRKLFNNYKTTFTISFPSWFWL